MTVAAHLTQSQRQTLGFRQIQAINLLRLSNEELTAELSRRAAANPFLRLHLPRADPARADEQEAETAGLYAHVMGQLRMIAAARADLALAMAFVEALDGNGWLDQPVSGIATAAGRSVRVAETMLDALQHEIEPAGLFARDLADCLRIQAQDRNLLNSAMQAVLRHLDLVADAGLPAVAKATGLALDEVAACLAQIRRMDPRPGLAFGGSAAPPRAPDVIVSRGSGGWVIGLNRSTLPQLDLVSLGETGTALRAVRAEAEWLASIVERRNRTVLAVSRAVLLRQRDFLDHGPAAMKALSRSEIALGLGLHDSTVCRVARDLLIQTPHGMRTLCSLFSTGRAGKSDLAASALRHRLGQLIAAEDQSAPLSDAALADMLGSEGQPLARRTVAKYRDALGIAPRDQRLRAAGCQGRELD